jgi:hypothetical protein
MRSVSCSCHIHWTLAVPRVRHPNELNVKRPSIGIIWTRDDLLRLVRSISEWNVDNRRSNPPVQLQRSREFCWNVSHVMAFWREIFDSRSCWDLSLMRNLVVICSFPAGHPSWAVLQLGPTALHALRQFGRRHRPRNRPRVRRKRYGSIHRFFACRCLQLFSFTRCALVKNVPFKAG